MRWAVETEVDEILPSLVGWSLVEHASSINDHDLIHKFVDTLSRLVQCHKHGAFAYVCHNTEGFGIVKCSTGVQTSSTVVPCKDSCFPVSQCQCLLDRSSMRLNIPSESFTKTDSLTFSSRHTPNELITDNSVRRVGDTKHFQQSVNNDRYTVPVMLLGFVHQCKLQGLPDSECGEMLVIFRVIYDFTPKILVLLLGRETAVRDLPIDSSISFTVVGNSL